MRRARRAELAGALEPHAAALLEPLQAVEDALIQWRNKAPQDPLNYPPRLSDKLTLLLNLTNGDPRPTQGMRDVLAYLLDERLAAQQAALEAIEARLLPAFNQAVLEAKLPAVVDPESGR